MIRTPWLKHGFWNTLEHAFTRVADALVTFVMLWALPPELFATLGLAQAWVAPLLFFFIAPETVLYRDFGRWKAEGPDVLAARMHSLRAFAWRKAWLAILLALALAWIIPLTSSSWQGSRPTYFFAILWAFAMALAPQLSGPDREYLRMDLQLPALNALTFLQKAALAGGTALVALIAPARIELYALVAVSAALGSALLAQRYGIVSLRALGATQDALSGKSEALAEGTIKEAVAQYSLWQHASGVISNWIRTMDVFFLGIFQVPARQIGLYAAVVKLANFSTLFPTAFTNLFSIWIGRRTPEAGDIREKRELLRMSLLLTAGAAAATILIALLAPWTLDLLSRGKWTSEEQNQMAKWLLWLLIGRAIYAAVSLVVTWLSLRTPMKRVFTRIYLQWGISALLIFGSAAYLGATDSVAMANVWVYAAFGVLVLIRFISSSERKSGESDSHSHGIHARE